MLDQLLDLFERDRRSSTPQQGGLRGKLGSLLGGESYEPEHASQRANDRRRNERARDDDDHDDHDRRPHRSNRREFEPFDFGD